MNNKVLVTGSSRGIGRAIGEFFSKNDWDVCFTSRNLNDLEEFKKRYHVKNRRNSGGMEKPGMGEPSDREDSQEEA